MELDLPPHLDGHGADVTSEAAMSPTNAEGMSPLRALTAFDSCLTDFERREVTQQNCIYFVSPQGCKSGSDPSNGVFDDQKGRYLGVLGDHIAYRYELCSKLGKGAFGDVYLAKDHATGAKYALKVIRNERRFHRQAKVEVAVLSKLKEEDPDGLLNTVAMVRSFEFRSHVCIVFELAGNDLYSALKEGRFAGFSQSRCRKIAGDILKCMALCERKGIVHADLKPENILLRPDGDDRGEVVVIDFGSACFAHGKIHTYIQSRYYRSPEVVLGMGYGPAVDMWSLGCILVELVTGRPIFAAKSETELVLLITELLGLPSDAVLSRSCRGAEFFPGGLIASRVDRKGRIRLPGSRSLEAVCAGADGVVADPAFYDFVRRCLTWDPAERLTPSAALRHPYLARHPGTPERRPSPRVANKGSPIARLKAATGAAGSVGSLNDSGIDESETSVFNTPESGDPMSSAGVEAPMGWNATSSPLNCSAPPPKFDLARVTALAIADAYVPDAMNVALGSSA